MSILDKIDIWADENPTSIALNDEDLCKELFEELSHKQDAPCPYCGECTCKHWTGLGWRKNK